MTFPVFRGRSDLRGRVGEMFNGKTYIGYGPELAWQRGIEMVRRQSRARRLGLRTLQPVSETNRQQMSIPT